MGSLISNTKLSSYKSDILENMEQSGDSCEVSSALKSIDLKSTKENTLIEGLEGEEKTGCFLCQNPDPIKKCSKSHSRCKGKLFCNKNGELSFHKSEKTKALEDAKKDDAENSVDENKIKLAKEVEAAAKAEKAKLKKAKKKDKKATSAEQTGATAYNNTFL